VTPTVRATGNLRRGERINGKRKNVGDVIFEIPSTVIFVEVRKQIDHCIQNNRIIKLAKLCLKCNASDQEWLKTQPKQYHSN
jgi:hypothetical protein